ncbi:MAG: methyltransferase domain-containing protein [Spirochaetales bacterium]|nr:methyltransferase domain-containing protein [Leptospiraceae bacterium]MCP5482346.1 methyltransferase domain-containing protein [Spirochaetales bacterium]MCP5484215.1 methyltransferase domain-containing protein [Spirochaetales bacterium]
MADPVPGKVGDEITVSGKAWTFGGDVPVVFDQHVSRSVPLYAQGHELILRLSDYFVLDNSTVYDIGCSTGELLRKLSARHTGPARFVGVDREEAMIKEARKRCSEEPRIELIAADFSEIEHESSDLIIAYYTMQFVPARRRQQLFDMVYNSLNWGGAFLLFEKVRAPDARFQDIVSQLYNDFKVDNGYEGNEILAKSRSLKGVLEPFSTQGNIDLMTRAGFKDIMSIFKYLCFEGFFAIK